MKTPKLLIVGLFLVSQAVLSQDPQFINTNGSLLSLNPSFAGSNGGVRVQYSLQNQGPQSSRRLLYQNLNTDFYLKALKAGIGISGYGDDEAHGTFKYWGLALTYAQHIKLGENLKFIPSLRVGAYRSSLDLSALTFGDPMTPRTGFVWNDPSVIPVTRKEYVDWSSGFLFEARENFYLGAYFFHLNRPDVGLLGQSRLPVRTIVNASYSFNFNNKQLLQLSARFSREYNFNNLNLSANTVLFNHLIAGAGISNFDTPYLIAGARGEYCNIFLSYGQTASKLAGSSQVVYELHIAVNARSKARRDMFTVFEKM
jgi:type IX secretion system PorP/SprF family membrane protein